MNLLYFTLCVCVCVCVFDHESVCMTKDTQRYNKRKLEFTKLSFLICNVWQHFVFIYWYWIAANFELTLDKFPPPLPPYWINILLPWNEITDATNLTEDLSLSYELEHCRTFKFLELLFLSGSSQPPIMQAPFKDDWFRISYHHSKPHKVTGRYIIILEI